MKRIVRVFPNNSIEIDGVDYSSGSEKMLELMREYGIPEDRSEDSRHREMDGTYLILYATRKQIGKARTKTYNLKKNLRNRQERIRERVNALIGSGVSLQKALEAVAKEMFLSCETTRQNYYGFGRYRCHETQPMQEAK